MNNIDALDPSVSVADGYANHPTNICWMIVEAILGAKAFTAPPMSVELTAAGNVTFYYADGRVPRTCSVPPDSAAGLLRAVGRSCGIPFDVALGLFMPDGRAKLLNSTQAAALPGLVMRDAA